MNPVIANESELYFERGGPVYRLMQRIGVIRGEDPSVRRRIFWFLAVTWIPLLILSFFDGRALGSTPRESFLLDFATYVRFFVMVPILIVAEGVVGPRLTGAGLQFMQAGFVQPEDYPAFEKTIARVVKWRESLWAELIILGVAFAGAWTFRVEILLGGEVSSWYSITIAGKNGAHVSFAGLWYFFIAVPLFQFFWFRWFWRLFIWASFLFTVSRLNLKLVPTHADEAGGLGFLATAHTSLGIFSFGLGSVLSADAAFRMIFEGAHIDTFKLPFIILLVVTEVIFLSPLVMFTPILARKRREWLRTYSLLVVRYNRAFHEKWIEEKTSEREPLLGSADMQSLADLGAGFQFIRAMKLVPFSPRVVLQLAVVAALPGLPLILLAVPVEKVIDALGRALF